MDNLTKSFLLTCFLFSGSSLAALALFTFFMLGVTSVSYLTLFAFVSLLTYSFYGLFGLMYVLLASSGLLCCAFMYWFNLTSNDIYQKLDNFRAMFTKDKSEESNFSLRKKLFTVLSQRTGLNDTHCQKISQYYQLVSHYFDKFVSLLSTYLVKFRNLTQNVSGFNRIYNAYDTLSLVGSTLENAKNIHQVASNLPSFDKNFDISQLLSQFGQESFQSETNSVESLDEEINDDDNVVDQLDTDDQPVVSKKKDSVKIPSFGNFNMNEMQKQLNNMSPQQKNQMDKMTKELLGNLNLNDMMGMMNNFQSFNQSKLTKRR